jgi:hypothetical protein
VVRLRSPAGVALSRRRTNVTRGPLVSVADRDSAAAEVSSHGWFRCDAFWSGEGCIAKEGKVAPVGCGGALSEENATMI